MRAEIIALGETFHGTHTEKIKKFLETAPQFNGFFLEDQQDNQGSMDDYLATGQVNARMEDTFARTSGENKYIRDTRLLLLDYARAHDLPVVCIDSSKVETEKYNHRSPSGYWFVAGESRNEDMSNTIKEHLKKGDRWLLVGGYQHLKFGLHFRSGDKTLGERLNEYIGDGYKLTVLE